MSQKRNKKQRNMKEKDITTGNRLYSGVRDLDPTYKYPSEGRKTRVSPDSAGLKNVQLMNYFTLKPSTSLSKLTSTNIKVSEFD